MPGKICAVVYASPTAAPERGRDRRVRRKPVPRLTRLPTAITALLPAALPLRRRGSRRGRRRLDGRRRVDGSDGRRPWRRGRGRSPPWRGVRAAGTGRRSCHDSQTVRGDPCRPPYAADSRAGRRRPDYADRPDVRILRHLHARLAADADRRPAQRRRRAAARLARRRRAGPPVRRRRPRAAPRRRLGARRAARPARRRPRLRTDAHPDETLRRAQGLGRGDLGDRPRVRHDRRPARRAAAGDHHVPGRGLRRGEPQPGRARTARACVDDLRRRDFTVNAMAVSLPDHRFTDPYGGLDDLAAPGDPYARHAGGVVRRRSAADAAGRPVRRAAAASPSTRRCGAAMARDGRRPRPDHRRADPRRVHQAALRRRPGHRAAAAGRHRAGRPVPAGAVRAASWRSTSTPSTRTSTSTRSPSCATPSAWRTRRAATSCCGWPR